MVKVRADFPVHETGSVDLVAWVARLPNVNSAEHQDGLVATANWLQENTEVVVAEGMNSPFYTGLEMVEILADLSLDAPSLQAAILYRSVREKLVSLEQVQLEFGELVAELIDGVSRMAAITQVTTGRELQVFGQAEAQSETVRKMLVALVDDVRVALIKLAERTCAIRSVKDRPDKRYRVAKEVFDIYAPLAHRLGIGHIKWELEDLSFRYLQPQAYKKIARLLDEKRLSRQQYIDQLKNSIRERLAADDIHADVVGRAKHIYSIWRKMQRKGIGFSQVYDVRAIRILVEDVRQCYAVLGLVHGLWRNIPNEFDDYIANPKDNGYRSLHTAVIGPEGKVVEIQIRTHQMHEESEFGVCAHWLYKGTDAGKQRGDSYEDKITWLRTVLDWHEEGGDGDVADLTEEFSQAQDRVYLFTPKGHAVNLAKGATPLDFAYHIHTEIGHRCRGAKVNGNIVPLNYELKTGERVEILTGNELLPRREWLRRGLGYLNTSRARSKVQHWFRQQAREDNAALGRGLIEKEFKRLALTSVDYKIIADRLNCAQVDDLFANVGAGEIGFSSVLKVAYAVAGLDLPKQEKPKVPAKKDKQAGQFHIRGVGSLVTQVARCCNPLPGEDILGYITVGRGVTVHRQDCSKLLDLQDVEPERIVEVSWTEQQDQSYRVVALIEAYDRRGLLRDITSLFSDYGLNVDSMQTTTDPVTHVANLRLAGDIENIGRLSALFNRVNSLPNVISVNREREG